MDFDANDIGSLAHAIDTHYSAKSPTTINGTNRFIYFVPKQEQDVDVILSMFQKYGVTGYKHKSSLNPIPVVRVPWTNDIAITAPNFFPLIAELDKAHANTATAQTKTHTDNPKPNAETQNAAQKPDAHQITISEYDRSVQDYQLQTLKELTGLDFIFVPADKSPLHIKSYVCKCKNSDEWYTAHNILASKDLDVLGNNENELFITENSFDCGRAVATMNKQANPEKFGALFTESIGKINGHDVYLEPFFKSSIVEYAGRAVAVVNINGKSLPFYVSSGQAGKDKDGIPSGRWYPLVGIGKNWFNKMPDMMHNPYPELDQVASLLEKHFPATELKQIALTNDHTHKLRNVENKDLQEMANKDFPEGVQDYYDQRVYERVKNLDVYLPAIIHAWRTPATAYLETHNNAISQPIDNLIQKIQRKIHAEITQTNGIIQFLPNVNQTQYMIRQALEKIGFNVGENLQISADDLMTQYIYPRHQKQQRFADGKQHVEEKQKGFLGRIRAKLDNVFE